MGVIAELKEPIDGDILNSVVQELSVRFPYFYVKTVARDNDIFPQPNPLPMIVRDTWAPINFNSPESNHHPAAWKYEGSRMAFEISHSLTDGAGVFPYMKSALYLYLTRKTGEKLDPAGIRLPGEAIPASETGNPFADLDIDAAEGPLYTKPPTEDFYRVKVEGDTKPQIHYIKLEESQQIRCCRDFDGSPNAMIAMLGARENYRLFANVIELDFPKSRSLDDLMKSCTMARGQMILQAQPENSLWAMKQRKLNAIAKSAGNPRWSFAVSYTNSRSMGSVDPYLEALYVVAEPGVFDIGCEIACVNHNFYISIMQPFSADRFVDLFLEELSSVGIEYEVTRKEPLCLCGIESFESC